MGSGVLRYSFAMSSETGLGGAQIRQILMPVSDLDRAVAFYGDVLGLPLQMRFPGIAFFDAAGIRLYLASPSDAGFTGVATIYFWVADTAATFESLVGRGATARESPSIVYRTEAFDMWLAFVDDPDGNHIGLMHEAPRA
jgi:catechol 2,3-dioxygenase-like lactoylglutathione lyase family enzyme